MEAKFLTVVHYLVINNINNNNNNNLKLTSNKCNLKKLMDQTILLSMKCLYKLMENNNH